MKKLILVAALLAAGGFNTAFAGGSFVNVSPSATPTTSDASCKNVGDLVSDALPKDQWVTSNRANGELTDTLTWTEEVCLSAVEVYFQSNHKTSVPTFTTGTGSSIAFTPRAEEVVGGEYRKIRYDFDTPTSLTVLTCFFPSPGQSQWLTVNRIWAYENQGGSDDPDDPPDVECTLTLDPKGGTVDSTTVELPAESLPTPTREGFHFVGWFKDEIDASAPYVRGKYLCGEPLISATADDKDNILYAKWVKNDVYNHFQGKKVVFMGDSVTTLHGYEATAHQRYTSIQYTEEVCAQWGVTEKNTWWAQLVQALDMNLLSVNAVAGAPVVEKTSPAAGPRAFSCTARIDDLDVNGVPDVLFIFGGINDFNGSGATIDDFDSSADYLTDELDLTSNCFDTFAKGYATLIRRVRHYYPDTEIVIIAPYAAGDTTIYNKGDQTIIDLCAYFNIPCLDLRSTQLPRWENGVRMAKDAAHPIPAGFTEFANYVLENYVPACAHANRTELTGVVAATCTTDGYTGDCTCEDCGETIYGHVVTKLGHDWGEWEVTKEASTTEDGLRERDCRRDGCSAHEEEVIPKIAAIVALRNVAVATAVGTAPTLPAKVAGLKTDGTVSGEYAVVWESAAVPESEGITTVTGTATVNDAPMSVTASVRAVTASGGDSGELVNIAPLASQMTVTCSNGNAPGDVSAITNGWGATMTIGGWNTPGNGWNIWPKSGEFPFTATVDFTWSAAKKVSKIFVASWDDNQHAAITLKNGVTGEALTGFTYTQDGNDYYKINQGDGNLYVFAQPVELSRLRIESTSSGRYLGFYEIEVWAEEGGSGGSVEPLTTDTLNALQVDGEDVADFASTTYGYTVQGGKAITSATSEDNVGITILPKYNGSAYAVTLAEDGTSTKTYTVAMPPSSAKSGFMIIVR